MNFIKEEIICTNPVAKTSRSKNLHPLWNPQTKSVITTGSDKQPKRELTLSHHLVVELEFRLFEASHTETYAEQ